MARSRHETQTGIRVPAEASPAWLYTSGDLGNRNQRGISEVVLAAGWGRGEEGAPGKPEFGKADREQARETGHQDVSSGSKYNRVGRVRRPFFKQFGGAPKLTHMRTLCPLAGQPSLASGSLNQSVCLAWLNIS